MENRKEIEEIAGAANIRGKIKSKHSILFSTEDKEQYAIIVNRISINKSTRLYYAVRLINYERNDKTEVEVKATKRFPDLMHFYQTKEKAIEDVKKIKEDQELINKCIYEHETNEDAVENILIIGQTGAGKSTLANVISDVNEFTESEGSVSQTKTFQTKCFNLRETKYRVVDTVGIADTELSKRDVMYKLAEAIHTMKKGINQVFVVVKGRFTKEAIETFDLVKVCFGEDIVKHVTIVRTGFEDFEDKDMCKRDREALKKENEQISYWIDSCKGIVYVNNPPSSKRRLDVNKNDREKSRKILLDHLESCQGSYKMDNWDKVCVKINDFMNIRKLIEEDERHATKEELREVENKVIEGMGEIKGQLEKAMAVLKDIQTMEGAGPSVVRVRVNFPGVSDIEMVAKFNRSCCTII